MAPRSRPRESGDPYAVPSRSAGAYGSLLSQGRLAVMVTLLTTPLAHAAEPSPQQIDAGREVYAEFCAMCHGRDMVNVGGFAFDLRKFPKDDVARFRNSVLNGKNQGMPAWRDKLSDDDLTVLWAYIGSGGNN
jgi:mono/diheme cytochrome c family protein